jgi:transposase
MSKAGVDAHLAEPAETSARRGPKRPPKTDKADAKLLRELLATGRLPERYIPPAQVLEWRAMLELYQDLRTEHTGWAQRIQSVCFHQGTTAPGQAGIVRGDRARLQTIIDEQLSIVGRLQVNTALAMMDTVADHLDRLRRRLLSTSRGVKGARACWALSSSPPQRPVTPLCCPGYADSARYRGSGSRGPAPTEQGSPAGCAAKVCR